MNKHLAAFFLSFTIFTLSAQKELSLADAIQEGLANNYDILLEKRKVSLTTLNNSWGETNLFPSLSASIRGTNNTFDNQQAINPFSIIGRTVVNQIEPTVQLQWNLMQIYNIKIEKDKLKQLQAESEGNADIVIQNTVQAIILGYYIAVLEEERLGQFQQQLNLSRDKYAQVQMRMKLGSATTSNLLLEEGNYLLDSTNVVTQELAYKNALSNLNFILAAEEPVPDYILLDSLDYDPIDISLEQLMGQIGSDNLDLKKQYLTQSILEVNTDLSRISRYPTITLGANYRLNYNRQDVSDWPLERRQIRDGSGNVVSILDVGDNMNANYGANFTVSFNLFNGRKINRAIQRAKLNERMGTLRIEQLKTSLNRDAKQAFDRYNARKKIFEISRRRRRSSLQNLDISGRKFKNGTINSFDYRTVQNNHLQASIQELQAAYNLIDAKITILRLTGMLMKNYVSE